MAAEGATSPAASPVRRFGDIKALRTQAMPSNTLFGSILERLRPEEEAQLRAMDLSTLSQVARSYEAPKVRGKLPLPLPDGQTELLQRQFGAEIEDWHQEFHRQRSNLQRTDGRLKQLHDAARFDLDHPLDLLPSGESMRKRHGQWMTEADLHHAAEMNRVGLRPKAAAPASDTVPRFYNRDKYGCKAPVHRYGLIGDVFRPGMDFDVKSRLQQKPQHADLNQKSEVGREKEKMRKLPPSKHVIPGSQLEIPANIKHQFGSQLCEEILSDPNKVEESKRRTATATSDKPTARKSSTASKPTSPSKEQRASPSYDLLGGTLRANVFPGYTRDHQMSNTHRIHTQQVYDRRVDVPDQFRFQWDHVSRWNEANVMHDRMMKGESEEKGPPK